MKFFGWMQNKLNGKQACKKLNPISSASHHTQQEPRVEFSDWPQSLLAIGTLGNGSLKECPEIHGIQEEPSRILQEQPSNIEENDASSPDDLQNFTSEEVGKLQKELTKLLSRTKKRTSDVEREMANLPLNRFLNCPSSLEVDRRISNALCTDPEDRDEDIERTISAILGRCKDICADKKRKEISKKSISFLLRKMFVCSSGFSPAPSLRDTLHESRMEKLLRTLLRKKIFPQSASRAPSMKKFLEGKKKQEEEQKGNAQGCKWVKTDSDFIVLEI